MKRKTLMSVLLVVAVSVVFSTLVSAQEPQCKVNWPQAASSVKFQIDRDTIEESLLQAAILDELSDPNLCESKKAFYKTALDYLNEVLLHTSAACGYCKAMQDARSDKTGGMYLLMVLGELSKASDSFTNALQYYYEAKMTKC